MFNGFPFGGMVPIHMMSPPQPSPPDHSAKMPNRVRAAMEFYAAVNDKTKTRACVTEHQCHEIPGQALEPEEKKALWAAMHCLAQYFSGTLEKTEWDAGAELENLAHLKLSCPACKTKSGVKDADCNVCGGEGHVYILRAV